MSSSAIAAISASRFVVIMAGEDSGCRIGFCSLAQAARGWSRPISISGFNPMASNGCIFTFTLLLSAVAMSFWPATSICAGFDPQAAPCTVTVPRNR